jgi:hypothetical protein
MARKPYRVELIYAKGRKPQYYLTKDIWFKGKKDKVRTYIGTEQPTIDEIELARKFAFNLEIKAARKIGKISEDKFLSKYIPISKIADLEELRYLYKKFNQLLTKNEISAYEQKFELQYVQGTTSRFDLHLYGCIFKCTLKHNCYKHYIYLYLPYNNYTKI